MKQLVHEQPSALPLVVLGDHLPVVRGPRDAAPLDRGVHEGECAGSGREQTSAWRMRSVPVNPDFQWVRLTPHTNTLAVVAAQRSAAWNVMVIVSRPRQTSGAIG